MGPATREINKERKHEPTDNEICFYNVAYWYLSLLRVFKTMSHDD